MDRREFLAKAGLVATWAGIAVTVGCGDDENTTMAPSSNDIAGTVTGGGHTHSVTITDAQVAAGASVMLTLSGSGHTHTVSLTADQVMRIANNETVITTSSSSGGHDHTVRFL
ncbi:MAG: hypothetical protein DHS20C21_11440 [Gemmatimonadota bacterium]|nr:MAG: hypothetical protein DHS20C21_11440 [Gemmatimonadota bacterium]